MENADIHKLPTIWFLLYRCNKNVSEYRRFPPFVRTIDIYFLCIQSLLNQHPLYNPLIHFTMRKKSSDSQSFWSSIIWWIGIKSQSGFKSEVFRWSLKHKIKNTARAANFITSQHDHQLLLSFTVALTLKSIKSLSMKRFKLQCKKKKKVRKGFYSPVVLWVNSRWQPSTTKYWDWAHSDFWFHQLKKEKNKNILNRLNKPLKKSNKISTCLKYTNMYGENIQSKKLQH